MLAGRANGIGKDGWLVFGSDSRVVRWCDEIVRDDVAVVESLYPVAVVEREPECLPEGEVIKRRPPQVERERFVALARATNEVPAVEQGLISSAVYEPYMASMSPRRNAVSRAVSSS